MTTPDIAGLCEKLRETRAVWSEGKEAFIKRRRNPDGPEAADTLERQAAEIAALRDEVVEARTLDKGFYEWMIERDLLARGEEVEWGDIVVALTEHEIELTRADERQAAEIERLRGALGGIKWRSVCKDNIKFSATITCWQMDAIRAALTGEDA